MATKIIRRLPRNKIRRTLPKTTIDRGRLRGLAPEEAPGAPTAQDDGSCDTAFRPCSTLHIAHEHSDGGIVRGTGWLPDLPDFRDETLSSIAPKFSGKQTEAKLYQETVKRIQAAKPPKKLTNLEKHCSPIEDQGELGSCTAQAVAGLVECMERQAGNSHVDASRLFLYKATRNILGWTGDTGAYIRETMQALHWFGVPPESVWPYDIDNFDVEPEAYEYAFARNYRAVQYLRLDENSGSTPDLEDRVKRALTAGFPVAFGFSTYSSLSYDADIPFPSGQDTATGGHAVLAVGYDDNRVIGAHKGALRIRNSWGTRWGDKGYGWLPYEYLKAGLALDFWICTHLDWSPLKD